MGDKDHYVLVRVSLPDRPGALGAVASRIGATHGDIVGVDVLERSADVAMDEFAVAIERLTLVPMLVREIEEVDGVSVVDVRTVERASGVGLLESAARLCESDSVEALFAIVVTETRHEFRGDGAALVAGGRVLMTDGRDATDPVLRARDDVVAATLPSNGATLVVLRDGHPFRATERERLATLARIADRAWSSLDR